MFIEFGYLKQQSRQYKWLRKVIDEQKMYVKILSILIVE